MKRSIEICGLVVLCAAVGSCGGLPPPSSKDETSRAPVAKPETVTEPESEAAAPEVAQAEPDTTVPRGGPREVLTCFAGTEDRHARIGVELVNDRVIYFAYYSKWKPRTCSIDAGRGDARSRWADNGTYSTVTLPDRKGQLQIERKGNAYRFAFLNVDRVRYCGMPGKINGSLTVAKGKSKCVVEGVMDGHSL